MKKNLLAISFVFLAAFLAAQAPQTLNYQAVARNAQGTVMANATISVEFRIHDQTVAGAIVFDESFSSVQTNQFGLFTLAIGDPAGTAVVGTIDSVKWGSGPKYLEVDLNGTTMGTTQMLSVPYALYAQNAGAAAATNLARVAASATSATTTLTSTVGNYLGGTVTINTPDTGIVEVDASVILVLEHVTGTLDVLMLNIGTSATDAGSYYDKVIWTQPAELPTFPAGEVTFRVRSAYNVGAGPHTFYLNGYMDSGGTANDAFYYASMHAVYYPVR